MDPEFVDKGKVVALFPCILEGELPENGEVVEERDLLICVGLSLVAKKMNE